MRCRLPLLLSLILLSINLSANSQIWEMLTKSGVYENYEIRQKHKAVLLSKSFEAVDAPKRIFTQAESDINVRFEVRKTADAYYLMFINQFQDRFPVWSSGTYIVKKDLKSGDFVQAKIFLYNNEESFIRIYPEQNRARLDLHLFGNKIYSGIRVPYSLDKLILLPLSRIIELTENKIPWSDLFSDTSFSEWDEVKNFANRIKSLVPDLGDSEDGAMDESGNFVYIETLNPQVEEAGFNCSGFSKWVVDLMYEELTGEYMPISPLKKKHYDLRGNSWSERAEEDRDPYFGLDWTRNIAWYYRSELYPRAALEYTAMDVNSVPFFDYKESVGYDIGEVEAVLFLEALRNPGRIYLGSVNRPFGETNILRQHVHVVVLFPYFDDDNRFVIDVIERQTITGMESLKTRFKGEFLHLVNIELHNRSY